MAQNKLGQTVYYKYYQNGNEAYRADTWGGNAPYGSTLVTKDEYLTGLQNKLKTAQDFVTKYPDSRNAPAGITYDQNQVNKIQQELAQAQGNQGIYADNYIAGGFEKFNPYGMPDEKNYTPQAQAEMAKIPVAYGGTGANQAGQLPVAGTQPQVKTLGSAVGGSSLPANYTVKSGDSLSKIAAQYGLTWQQLYDANKAIIGSNPNLIQPGMTFTIPGASGSATGANNGSQQVPQSMVDQFNSIKTQADQLTGGASGAGGTGTGTGATTITPEQQAQIQAQQRQATIDALNLELNKSQVGAVNSLTGQVVQMPVAPQAPNFTTEYQNLQNQQGIQTINDQIAANEKAINDLQALTSSAIAEEGTRKGPNAIISARKSKISESQSIELNRLQNEKVILQNQKSNALNTINTLLQLKQQDYATAYKEYQDNYDRQIQLQQIFNQNQDRIKSDASASLNTILGAITGSGTSFESLSPLMQAQISNLGIQVGIQPEFLPYLMQVSQGPGKVITTATSDAGDVSVIMQNPDGTLKVTTLKGIGNAQGNTTPTQTNDKFFSAIDKGKTELQQGETWGNVWNRIKAQFPNKSNAEIDNALGVSWKEPGAYQKFKSQASGGGSTSTANDFYNNL